jgi:CheY-like chemotaxis protein
VNTFSAHHPFDPGTPAGLASALGFEPGRSAGPAEPGMNMTNLSSLLLGRGQPAGSMPGAAPAASFNFRLPAAATEAAPAARAERSTRGARVLFMDDDEHICVLTASMLESLGYACDPVRNGGEAIRLYQRNLDLNRRYEVVIMDLNIIGGIGGEEVFRVLRELDPGVRAIIASGYDNDDKSEQLLELGFVGYLAKPYRVAELDAMVRAALDV